MPQIPGQWFGGKQKELCLLPMEQMIGQYPEEKKELLESLELYYRVFFLGEEVPEEALMEEDGEKPNGK